MENLLVEFEHEWWKGSRDKAKEIAYAYIKENFLRLAPILGELPIEELVKMVSAYREAGREEDRIIVDMWLLTQFGSQPITGELALISPLSLEALGLVSPSNN